MKESQLWRQRVTEIKAHWLSPLTLSRKKKPKHWQGKTQVQPIIQYFCPWATNQMAGKRAQYLPLNPWASAQNPKHPPGSTSSVLHFQRACSPLSSSHNPQASISTKHHPVKKQVRRGGNNVRYSNMLRSTKRVVNIGDSMFVKIWLV